MKTTTINTNSRIFKAYTHEGEFHLFNLEHVTLKDLESIKDLWHLWNFKFERFGKRQLKTMIIEDQPNRDKKAVQSIKLTRVNSDNMGNPRYAVHFLSINDDYDTAVSMANKIGGRKFNNKQYGGGIVFQSYNTQNLKESIYNLKNS